MARLPSYIQGGYSEDGPRLSKWLGKGGYNPFMTRLTPLKGLKLPNHDC